MSEQRCTDCIINRMMRGRSEEFGALLEAQRVYPDDPDDSERIAGLKDGLNIKEALRDRRPNRCIRLRRLLPVPEAVESRDHKPVILCAEVGAIALLYPNFSPEEEPANQLANIRALANPVDE